MPSLLRANDFLQSIGIWAHAEHRILICGGTCGVGQLPAEVLGHVSQTHGIKPPKDAEDLLAQALEEFNIYPDHDVPPPPSNGPPIELLKEHSDGLCCTQCSYYCLSPANMNKHWTSRAHADIASEVSPSYRYKKVETLQTFFAAARRKYFPVNKHLRQILATSSYAQFLRTELEHVNAPLPIPPAARPTEIPVLVKMTGWDAHLQDWITEQTTRSQLKQLCKLPQRTKQGIGALQDLCIQYLKECKALGKKAPFYVRQVLMEGSR